MKNYSFTEEEKTISKLLYLFPILIQEQDEGKIETLMNRIQKCLKDYHYNKEKSKGLVEASKLALHFCERKQMPTEFELDALAVDLRKALSIN